MSTLDRARTLIILLPALMFVGCPSSVDRRAMDGIDRLRACDMRGAHEAFADAHEMDASRSDVALAFAMTDIATLAEDPALTALAPRLGFDRAIDTSLLWGPDGLTDRLSRTDSCETIEDWFHTTFPHPSAREGGPSLMSTIDETLTVGDVRTALLALDARLEADVEALETAASDMNGEGVTLEGGCGIGSTPTRLRAPELLALAAALEGIRATALAARAYDGALRVTLLFDSSSDQTAWAQMMNEHMLHVTDASQLEEARVTLRHAVELARSAVSAARAITDSPSDAVIDWARLPREVLDDVDALGAAAHEGLASETHVVIPRLSPGLGLDLRSFFDEPLDFGDATAPLWTVETDEYGTWTRFDSAQIEDLLRGRFDADPWAEGSSYSWQMDWSDIQGETWESVFDPGSRWSESLACE